MSVYVLCHHSDGVLMIFYVFSLLQIEPFLPGCCAVCNNFLKLKKWRFTYFLFISFYNLIFIQFSLILIIIIYLQSLAFKYKQWTGLILASSLDYLFT